MNIVVVGAGLAGAKAVEELRSSGHSGDIVLVGAEPHLPYERPPLSKGLLLGTAEPESPFVHDAAWYEENEVEVVTGSPATAIDLDTRHVEVAGRQLPYDRLLLATGSSPRHLAMVDSSGADVRYLRTLDDSLSLKPRLGENLLVVGAGWIGLEVAAAAREAGGTVTVVEAADQPLLGVLGPRVAPVFADLHRDHGVDLRLATRLEQVEQTPSGTVARLSDGHEVRPDLVLVGVGAAPAVDLAARSGLATDEGVLVDTTLRASDPFVFAAGDVALHDHPTLGRIRVEHWDTAIQQGRHAARGMLGDDGPYTRLPYFFTDQYDLGMEYLGHATGDDEVVLRGDVADRVFTALWLRGDTVVAGMQVNDWDATDTLRALVGHEVPRARDADVALTDLQPGQ